MDTQGRSQGFSAYGAEGKGESSLRLRGGRREVPRFWKAVDAAGGSVPFEVRYVGVDHAKKEPADLLKQDGIRYLPTIIVRRGGHEVGRIVETSPHGVEQDLLALLTGKAAGVLSTRQDLSPATPQPQG